MLEDFCVLICVAPKVETKAGLRFAFVRFGLVSGLRSRLRASRPQTALQR
jgi:hypothetical protein